MKIYKNKDGAIIITDEIVKKYSVDLRPNYTDYSVTVFNIKNRPYFSNTSLASQIGFLRSRSTKKFFDNASNSKPITAVWTGFKEKFYLYDEVAAVEGLKAIFWKERHKSILGLIDAVSEIVIPQFYADTHSVQNFVYNGFGKVRVVYIGDDPWFVGVDVAKALGYVDPNRAIRDNVKENHKKSINRQLINGVTDTRVKRPGTNDAVCGTSAINNEITLIDEAGLYKLIFSSKLPSAEAFTDWVTSEVLPSIRKTGTYNLINRLKGGE